MKSILRDIFFFVFIGISATFAQTKEITLEGIWKDYTFVSSGVPGFLTMPKGDFYTVTDKDGIDKYSFASGEKIATLVTNHDLKTASDSLITMNTIHTYTFDNDESQLLMAIKQENIYRRSTKAFYYIYNIKSKTIRSLSDTAKGKQSFATFSNDGKKVAFVRSNNIFIKNLETDEEIQLTMDGLSRHIINGMADWVYEEELDMAQAFTWSPDGMKLAYLRFDEQRVKEFSMSIWGNLYPEEYKFKYPKAGEDNSLVDVYIYNLENKQKTKLDLGNNTNCYFPRMYWLSNSTDLMALKLNRHQNRLEFFRYNMQTLKQDLVYTDENPCWLEVTDQYYFLEDNQTMIATSERNGFNHIYKITFGGKITQLTNGSWEVAEISAIDKTNKLIYYLSNESGLLNRDLYCIDFNGKKKQLLTNGKGWNVPTFSPTAQYYRNVYSDLNTPPVYAIYDSKGKEIRVINDNAKYKEIMKEYNFANRELFSFTTKENVLLYGWMLKPADFDSTKKYPVLMYVYGGPGSQEVRNSFFSPFNLAWFQLLAQKGYIIVCVDGRGTAARGDDFEKSVYKQLGKLEATDQIDAAHYLKSLPYIDGFRIGIWGWSFGGYLSSLALMQGGDAFKMAIAVAPVTTWRYYDNIYTERFLQTPQENPSGYDENSPITHVDKMNGKYLLVHGTADDNVHFQNAIDLVTALNSAGKQYEQFFYPNKNHNIYGGNTRLHLYTKLTDFVLKNL
ncbi:MAG: S9 family peptidase [Bacteroidales bacterium]|jgi:dipeptidyl-peptidase-4|nr:S9 family peptidase [Bacteroidales bacterium]